MLGYFVYVHPVSGVKGGTIEILFSRFLWTIPESINEIFKKKKNGQTVLGDKSPSLFLN